MWFLRLGRGKESNSTSPVSNSTSSSNRPWTATTGRNPYNQEESLTMDDQRHNFGQTIDDIPPPSYNHVRNIDRPEIAGLIISRDGLQTLQNFQVSTTDVETVPNNVYLAPLTSSNLGTLEDIRYEDVARHVHMKSRISAVPQYPADLTASQTENPSSFWDTARRISQNHSSNHSNRRPISIASTNTAAIYMAVGQLPGSDHFFAMEASTSQGLESENNAVAQVGSVSPMVNENWEPETAQAVRVQQIVRNSPDGSTLVSPTSSNVAATTIRRTSVVSSISTPSSEGEKSPGRSDRTRSSSTASSMTTMTAITKNRSNSNVTSRPVLRPTITGPEEIPSYPQHHHHNGRTFLDMSEDHENDDEINAIPHSPPPPLPPPKDSGYVSRPRLQRPGTAPVYGANHMPYMMPHHVVTVADQSGIVLERKGIKLNHEAGYGYRFEMPQSQKGRREADNQRENLHQRRARRGGGFAGLRIFYRTPRSIVTVGHEENDPQNETSTTNHRGLQLFSACGRFIGKAIPKSTMLKGS